MSDKNPLRVIASELFPADVFLDVKDRVQDVDWDSFFNSLTGVGTVCVIASLGITVFSVMLSRATSGTVDPVSFVYNIISSLSLIAVAAYVIALLILTTIKSTINGEPAFSEQEEKIRKYFNFDSERPVVQFGIYARDVIISSIFIILILGIRSGLVLSTDVIGTANGYLEEFILTLFLFSLDLVYLGLVLILAGQLYETGQSLKKLAKSNET